MKRLGSFLTLLFFVTSFVLALLTGCTANQQDRWLRTTVDWHRYWVGLTPKVIKVGDIDFSFLEGGVAEGEILLMVHGYSASKDSWNLLSDQLTESYRILQVDLPGHGGTRAPKDFDYDLENQAEALHAFIEAMGLQRVHLLGNSMGGAVAMLYADRHPERLKTLILVDSAGVKSPKQSPFEEALEKGQNPLIVQDDASFQGMMELIMYNPPYVPWPYRPAIIRGAQSRVELNKKIFEDMMATGKRLQSQGKVEQLLSTLTVPTLILWGREDDVLDVSSVPVLQRYLPYSEVRIFDQVGHVPMAEVPKKTAQEVVRFVQAWK